MITLDLNKDKVIQIGEDKEHDSIIVMLEDEEFIQLQKQVNYYTDKVSLSSPICITLSLFKSNVII